MAIAATFWFNNWINIPYTPSADSSVSWDSTVGYSLSDSLKFDDEIYTFLNDSSLVGQVDGNGPIGFLAGSGISDNTIIPNNAIITGLTFRISRKTTFSPDTFGRFVPPYSNTFPAGISISDSIVQLSFNGQLIGNNKSSNEFWPQTNFDVNVYGGPNDTWGLSGIALTPYLINNAGFGISLLPYISWKGLTSNFINALGIFVDGQYIPYQFNLIGGLEANGTIDYANLTVHYNLVTSEEITPPSVSTEETFTNSSLPPTSPLFYTSDYLLARNIAKKEITDNSKITGITVRINKQGSDTTPNHNLETYDETVQLYLNGILIGDNRAKNTTIWPDISTGYQNISYGGSSDLWGLTSLFGSDINDEDFGVAINVRFKYDDENDVDNIKVDYVDIEFQYESSKIQQEIFPTPIESAEDFDNATILRTNARFLNQIFSPAYEVGYFDVMALSREINIDPHYDLSFSNLNTNYLFTANNITLNYKQESNLGKRLAGEGANPSTFKVDTRTYDLSFNIPIRIESWGYIDTVFSALYDFMLQGYKGSSTIYLGRILSNNDNPLVNVSSLKVDNIVDFLNLTTPFTAYIRSDDDEEEGETVTVTAVNKTTKILTLANQTTKSHTPSISYIWAKPTNPANNREPSFNIFSLREGLFTGCVVNSIKISVTPGQTLNAQINIKFTNLDRKYQSNIFSNLESILTNVNNRKPNFLINGSQVSIENSRIESSEFNLGDIKNSPLFRGYQESLIRDFEVNSFEINFENNLQAVYSLNAKSNSFDKNFIKNLQPYAYYSNGRNISGSIKYSSPLKPWLFAEKLAGPPSLNKQDLIVNFGPFKLLLPEIVWSPDSSESSVDEVHKKSVSFTVATEKLTYDPYFEPTGIL